jgi:hypothetical protein
MLNWPMHVYIDLAITWVLFIAIFPITFVWYRQAWRIAVNRDFTGVALKRGVPPPNPEKFAPGVMVLNLICGTILLGVVIGVATASLTKDEWTAMAGSTIWVKLILNWVMARHAHLSAAKPKKNKEIQ